MRKRKISDSALWKSLYKQKIKKRTTSKRHQNFDYKTIADRLRTVSWRNNKHPTGIIKPVNGYPTFPPTTEEMQSIGQTFKYLVIIILIIQVVYQKYLQTCVRVGWATRNLAQNLKESRFTTRKSKDQDPVIHM